MERRAGSAGGRDDAIGFTHISWTKLKRSTVPKPRCSHPAAYLRITRHVAHGTRSHSGLKLRLHGSGMAAPKITESKADTQASRRGAHTARAH